MRDEVLRMARVECHEQGVLYLRDFNLQIFAGEVMGLLAVNRSGLRTLIRLLCENIPIQRGFIYYRGKMINSWHGTAGQAGRICVIDGVHSLVPGMTVADNVFVLRQGFHSWIVNRRLIRGQLLPEFETLGIDISPDEYVEKLSPFKQVVVELLKAIMGGCRLVILKEISNQIAPEDIPRFHRLIRYFSQSGIAFLYIGYVYEELQEVCDRTALLMNGSIPKILRREECPAQCLPPFEKIISPSLTGKGGKNQTESAVFEVRNLHWKNIRNLSFSVCPGECIVLQDRSNVISPELIDLLLGNTGPEIGELFLLGQPLPLGYTRDIAIITERPSVSMLIPELSVLDNLCFTLDHRLPGIWRNRRLRKGLQMELSSILDPAVFSKHTDQLTTSEKYDLIYGRIQVQRPKVVFCVRPFQGADMDLRMQIHEHLQRLLSQGCGVVVLTGTLTDILSIADQVIEV